MGVELRRTGRALAFILLNLALISAAAALNGWRWLQTGSGFDLAVTVLFSIWALFVLRGFITKPIYGAVREDGVEHRGVFSTTLIGWDQLTFADFDSSARIALLGYRQADGKEAYAAFNKKTSGADDFDAMKQAIFARLPDLPDKSPTVSV